MEGEAAILARIDEQANGIKGAMAQMREDVQRWQREHDRKHERSEERREEMVGDIAAIKRHLELTPSPVAEADRMGSLEGKFKFQNVLLGGVAGGVFAWLMGQASALLGHAARAGS